MLLEAGHNKPTRPKVFRTYTQQQMYLFRSDMTLHVFNVIRPADLARQLPYVVRDVAL
jgi:hypothetical protein